MSRFLDLSFHKNKFSLTRLIRTFQTFQKRYKRLWTAIKENKVRAQKTFHRFRVSPRQDDADQCFLLTKKLPMKAVPVAWGCKQSRACQLLLGVQSLGLIDGD